MVIRDLAEDTMLAEACCASGLEKQSALTADEIIVVRAGKIKVEWLQNMMPKGLSAKIAYESGKAVGFIEYMPIELSNSYRGKELMIVNCIMAPHTTPWGTVERGGRILGCGSALVEAMIKDVKNKCKGIVTPCGFGYTKDIRGFFGRFGFEEFKSNSLKMLIKIFEPVDLPSRVTYERRYTYQPIQGRLAVDVFWSSICPVMGPWQLLIVKDIAEEFGDRVVINDIRTDDCEMLVRFGIDPFTSLSTIFFDGTPMFGHPGPAQREEIREAFAKHLGA